ncbi:histone deacetylase family protein [Aureispira anguillae]|uniref:Histone deacetylase n=1 Tax=Aureispira anguillae TaxID=2864201 RepID=A0A915YC30_9BACT|nr:histone deacetylase [Aureispira anguillae]BDS10309.1 histone deacetylase [Aureispira anguillae]
MLKIAFSSIYKYELPEGHRFPMAKYELIPAQLLHQGIVEEVQFFEPVPLEEKWILRTHCAAYWKSLKELTIPPKAARKIGFPIHKALIERGRVIAQGTIDCALYALKYGVAMNVAGGTHHSFKDKGEGFCVLNDFAIASNYLLDHQLVHQILIVDLDVHQGNGTAKIFEKEPRVFTFSMHGAKNYPLQKEVSDLDVPLVDGLEDAPYLDLVQEYLPALLQQVQPDLVFYLSGVDVLQSDKLGRLGLTLEGCKKRDQMVFEYCKAANVPIAVSMGGGYSPKLAQIVDAHCNTFLVAQEVFFDH